MNKLYIVIPAYNEEENIEKCVNDWYPIVEKYGETDGSRLVIVNDGSKDKTYDILCRLAQDRPFLCALNKENGGHGPALIFGYRHAIEQGADYVFQTDSDGQTEPGEFAAFWEERDKYDAIIGERLVREDGKSRKFVEDVVCILLRIFFGVKAKDANAPFRLMKADIMKKYLDKLPSDFNIPNIMITTYFLYYKDNIVFKPISFKNRNIGKTSINIKKIVKIGIKALKDFYVLKKDM